MFVSVCVFDTHNYSSMYCIPGVILILKVVQFTNHVDQDEAAHNEQPHLDLNYLPISL